MEGSLTTSIVLLLVTAIIGSESHDPIPPWLRNNTTTTEPTTTRNTTTTPTTSPPTTTTPTTGTTTSTKKKTTTHKPFTLSKTEEKLALGAILAIVFAVLCCGLPCVIWFIFCLVWKFSKEALCLPIRLAKKICCCGVDAAEAVV